uniref:Uncharacterized protein n=1 Tax=Ananas comosus var. bracteatus TaxID=296719 RepID=A0A6V7P9E0_ANACO|nr:unnamed protein product [Ananas comosus var. bracteatus]
MQAEARHHWEEAKGMRPNVWNRLESRSSFRPMKNDYEEGGSKLVPWLKSKIEQLAPSEPTKKVTRKALEEKIGSLETIIKRDRWPPKEREVWQKSDFLAKAQRIRREETKSAEKSAEESSADVSMVYALPHSLKTESIELEEPIYDGEELTVAQSQLEDAKVADAVVFEKPSALQTRFVRPLFVRALIQGRPVGRVMVDGGAIVNVMPTPFFKKLCKSEDELKPTDTIMADFTRNSQQTRGVLTIELTVRDHMEEIRAEGWPHMVDINIEEIGHIN